MPSNVSTFEKKKKALEQPVVCLNPEGENDVCKCLHTSYGSLWGKTQNTELTEERASTAESLS